MIKVEVTQSGHHVKIKIYSREDDWFVSGEIKRPATSESFRTACIAVTLKAFYMAMMKSQDPLQCAKDFTSIVMSYNDLSFLAGSIPFLQNMAASADLCAAYKIKNKKEDELLRAEKNFEDLLHEITGDKYIFRNDTRTD